MAKSDKYQNMSVPRDVYEDLYVLKGPGKTFGKFLRELIDAVCPPEDKYQTKIEPVCPECDEPLDQNGICPGCGYSDECESEE